MDQDSLLDLSFARERREGRKDSAGASAEVQQGTQHPQCAHNAVFFTQFSLKNVQIVGVSSYSAGRIFA